MISELIALATVAAGTGGALPLFVIPWLRRGNHYDVPSARSSHNTPVPRGGGIALLGGLGVGVVALLLMPVFGLHGSPDHTLWPLLLTPAAMSLLGMAEDFQTLGIWTRVLGQVCLAIPCMMWLLATHGARLWWTPLAAFVVVAYVNVTNFMDGINGISGMHGVIAGLTYMAVGFHLRHLAIEQAAVLLTALSAAFLPWNAPRARVFLGDCGSYLIGAWVACLGTAALLAGTAPEIALGPAAVYLADASWTIFRRYRGGEPLYRPHRSHVYQRLTDLGLSHAASTGVVSLATALVIVLTALGAAGHSWHRAAADTTAAMVLVGYLALPRLISLRGFPRLQEWCR